MRGKIILSNQFSSYQKVIKDIAMKMGIGMAKLILNEIMAIGTLALCYNNIKVFRGVVKMRRGLMAKVIDRTKSMEDVYGAFYDFSLLLESKDPNAKTTFRRIEAVQKKCRDLGTIDKRESYIAIDEPSNDPTLVRVALLIVILAILYAYLRPNRPT
ncbi:squalene synthase [Tanacetum coccineum]